MLRGILNVNHKDCYSDPGKFDSNPNKSLVYFVSTVAPGLTEQVTSCEYHIDSYPKKCFMTTEYAPRAGLGSMFL